MDLFILKYFLFSLSTNKKKKIMHTHTDTHRHIYGCVCVCVCVCECLLFVIIYLSIYPIRSVYVSVSYGITMSVTSDLSIAICLLLFLGRSGGILSNVLDRNIVVSGFDLSSRFTFTFGLIPFEQVWTLLLSSYELNVTSIFVWL